MPSSPTRQLRFGFSIIDCLCPISDCIHFRCFLVCLYVTVRHHGCIHMGDRHSIEFKPRFCHLASIQDKWLVPKLAHIEFMLICDRSGKSTFGTLSYAGLSKWASGPIMAGGTPWGWKTAFNTNPYTGCPTTGRCVLSLMN